MQSMIGKLLSLNKFIKLFSIVLLLAAIALTVILSQKQQNITQKAAAPDQLEAEGGVLGGNAAVVVDSNASGGQSVRFSASGITPSTPPTAAPTPINSAYAATYTATAATDQTAALKSFIETNKGKRIALSGIIPVTSLVITLPAGPVTTIDFLPGSRIKGIQVDAWGILRLTNSWDVVLNDPHVEGTSYQWDAVNGTAENQDGIAIYGGGRITLNRPNVHDTRGDGIYVGIRGDGIDSPPISIVVNDVNLYRNSRNGITPNAGEMSVTGGTIDQSGLHNIDMEPNTDLAAKSIRFTARNLRLTRHSNLAVHDPGGPVITGYAIAGLGYSDAKKQLIDIQGVSSDKFTVSMDRADKCYFTNNSSDVQVTCQDGNCPDTAFIYGMTSLTMSNNVNMIINTTYDIGGPR